MSSIVQDLIISLLGEFSDTNHPITLDEELDFDLFLSSLEIELIIERAEAALEREIPYDPDDLPVTVQDLITLCQG